MPPSSIASPSGIPPGGASGGNLVSSPSSSSPCPSIASGGGAASGSPPSPPSPTSSAASAISMCTSPCASFTPLPVSRSIHSENFAAPGSIVSSGTIANPILSSLLNRSSSSTVTLSTAPGGGRWKGNEHFFHAGSNVFFTVSVRSRPLPTLSFNGPVSGSRISTVAYGSEVPPLSAAIRSFAASTRTTIGAPPKSSAFSASILALSSSSAARRASSATLASAAAFSSAIRFFSLFIRRSLFL
mmetsp:Transcript_91068/g.260020  ORF Transcript_91068/g.260020 Transcript_91068/m.260020 type:complete len:243 (+) Transcript_91068:75-803(+)